MRTSNPLTCETCGDELTWVTHGAQTVQVCLRCAAKAGERSSESTRLDSPELEKIHRELPAEETLEFQLHGTSRPPVGPRSPAETPIEPSHVGRFVLKRILGRGSFGTVFHAYDPLLDREVALKVPNLVDGSHAMLERFIREAKAAALLRHPNVVTVFECRHADGHPYIASEFVDGTTLSRILNETPIVDLRLGVEWIRQIAEALHYAHTEGIIHRDIKPANIMISKSGRPQLMDFGLAKRITDDAAEMTVEGMIMGTPAYMSPEQARGEISLVGPASDQYSIGVVLFTLLSGEMPYRGAAMSIISRLRDRNDVVPNPRSIRPELPEDLEACCLKAMEKDPAARYANCQALAEDLKCWLEGRTLLARPIGSRERFVRWCHRNRMIAYLSGSLAGLLIAAMIAGFILAFRFQELARVASDEATNANAARLRETSTRQDLERLLVDNYTENGLTAARRHDYRQAVLWFAQSAIRAKQLPIRREHNLTRCAAWLAQVAVPVHAFYTPGDYCKALRFHPSGRYLIVESLAWECEIQDLSTHSQLKLPVATPISEARWSPDGKLLAIASNNSLSIFDFPTLQPIRQWAHPGPILTIAFNNQGTRLAIGGEQGLQVYDVANPQQASAIAELGGRPQAIQFSQDGDFVAVATREKHLHVYPLSTEGKLGELAIPNQTVATEGTEVVFGFLADGRLAIVDNQKALSCWDLNRSAITWERPIDRVICMDVSPDGKRLAYEAQGASYHHTAQVLEAATGQPWGGQVEHRNHIHSLDWHPDGKTLLAISSDHSASVTNMESGAAVVAMVPHNGFVLRGVCSPDGLTFATAHWHDRLVRVWKLPHTLDQHYLTPPENDQAFIKTTRDGLAGLLTGFDTRRTQREIQIHDTRTGKPIGSKIRSDGFINDAVHLPDHNLLVTGESVDAKSELESITQQALDGHGVLKFWDPMTGAVAHTAIPTATEPVAVDCDPSETTLVVLCDGGQLLLVDVKTGQLRKTLQAFPGPFTDKGFVIRNRIRFSPSGTQFALWGFGPEVQLRETQTGELQKTFRHPEPATFIHDARFAPRNTELVTCSSDNTLRGWNTETGREIAKLQHTGWVFNAKFSEDGTRLLTASSDRQARLWDWQNKTMLMSTMEQEDQIYGVAFVPRERAFITASRNGAVNTWETTTGKQAAPTRRFPDMTYQIEVNCTTGTMLVAGRFGSIAGARLDEWLKRFDSELPEKDLQLLAEIISNQKILETSVAANLTTDEWYQRWILFQARYPDHPLFSISHRQK